MFKISDIEKYIDQIPAIPKIILSVAKSLDEQDLSKAASLAASDLALINYMKNIVNKPIFGFKDELKEPKQIFTALGLQRARQIIYSYYVSLILPKNWKVFKLNNNKFADIQASFLLEWQKILTLTNQNSIELQQAITLVPSSISICESIFEKDIEMVRALKKQKPISYDKILFKATNLHFCDIVAMVAKKWEMPVGIIKFLDSLNSSNDDISVYLKLLVAYILSKEQFLESGLGDFFEFDIQCSDLQMETFYKAVKGGELETYN